MRIIPEWIKAVAATIIIMELSGIILLAPLEVHADVISRPVILAPKKVETLLVRSSVANRVYKAPKSPVVPAPFVSSEAVAVSKKTAGQVAIKKVSTKTALASIKATAPTSGKTRVVTATAYSSTPDQTDASPCTTANGYNVCKAGAENIIAANFLPFGAKVRIPDMFGDRVFTVQDRMHPRFSNRVDVWMKSRASAMQFGVRKVKIEIL